MTYEIACDKGNKAETLPPTKSFLNYIASADGQSCSPTLGYAPIPTRDHRQGRAPTVTALS